MFVKVNNDEFIWGRGKFTHFQENWNIIEAFMKKYGFVVEDVVEFKQKLNFSIETTLDHYGHVNEEMKKEAANKRSDALKMLINN